MKKMLITSVLLNVVLMVCLLALLIQRNRDAIPTASDFAQMQHPAEMEIASNQLPASVSNRPAGERPPLSQFSPWAATSSRHQSPQLPPVLPMVFQAVDLSQLNLNPDQLQAIEDLRQRFLNEIGGLEQDPNDPAYRERWLNSQPQIDDALRGMIGVTAFQDYQVQAATPLDNSH